MIYMSLVGTVYSPGRVRFPNLALKETLKSEAVGVFFKQPGVKIRRPTILFLENGSLELNCSVRVEKRWEDMEESNRRASHRTKMVQVQTHTGHK